jgi:hypothetical protein
MTAEFTVDDNEVVWLMHVKDIIISRRKTLKSLCNRMMFAKKVGDEETDTVEHLEDRLNVPIFKVCIFVYDFIYMLGFICFCRCQMILYR